MGSVPSVRRGRTTTARSTLDVVPAAPIITALPTLTVAENANLAHGLTANQTVTWAIVGGADADQFEVSGSTLRWVGDGTRDYEDPADAGANNTYIVTVRAMSSASGRTSTKTITVTVSNLAENHLPDVALIAGWTERYWRDFATLGGISLNSAMTDAGILTDTGEYKAGTMRYREGAQAGGTFNCGGIFGYGFDAFLDPMTPSLLSSEYRKARPLGEIEPIPGVGIRLHSRPNTGPLNKAELEAVPYGNKPYADAAGIELWSSAHIATYPTVTLTPPAARYCAFILRNTYAEHSFGAPIWGVEAGNRAYTVGRIDIAHNPLEVDDGEQLGWGSGGNGISFSIHAFNNRANIATNGVTPVVSVYDNRAQPEIESATSLINVLIEVVTVFDTTGLYRYARVGGTGAYALYGSVPIASLRNVSGDAEYDQAHVAFIHNIAAGHTWLGAAGAPTIPLALDIVKVGLFAPISNTSIVAPANDPPNETTLTWRGAYGPVASLESLAVGTVVADLTLGTGVTSVNVIGYGARFVADLSNLSVPVLKVAPAGLDFETQPIVRFALEGVKANGAKLAGRLYEFLVSDVAEGGGGSTPAWVPVRASDSTAADIFLDPPNNRAWAGGAIVALSTQIATNGSGGWDVVDDSALETFLNRTAKTEYIETLSAGAPFAEPDLAAALVSGVSQFASLVVKSATTVATTTTAGDLACTVGVNSYAAGKTVRAARTHGASGTRIAANGGTATSSAGTVPAAGTAAGSRLLRSRYGDWTFNGSLLGYAGWNDSDRISGANLTTLSTVS